MLYPLLLGRQTHSIRLILLTFSPILDLMNKIYTQSSGAAHPRLTFLRTKPLSGFFNQFPPKKPQPIYILPLSGFLYRNNIQNSPQSLSHPGYG